MTRRQTDATVKDSYGFGWLVGDGTVGHGGSYSTRTTIHLKHGIGIADAFEAAPLGWATHR